MIADVRKGDFFCDRLSDITIFHILKIISIYQKIEVWQEDHIIWRTHDMVFSS